MSKAKELLKMVDENCCPGSAKVAEIQRLTTEDVTDQVKELWGKGKSIAEIEQELGVKINVEGDIASQHKNIMDGKFTVEAKVQESRGTGKCGKLLELASSQCVFNTGGLPLAGRQFWVGSGQRIRVCSQDLKHVRYVNMGKDGTESSEMAYPVKDFDAWVHREVTPTDEWPGDEIVTAESNGNPNSKVEGFGEDLDKVIKALEEATSAVKASLSHGEDITVTPEDVKKVNRVKDMIKGLDSLVKEGL